MTKLTKIQQKNSKKLPKNWYFCNFMLNAGPMMTKIPQYIEILLKYPPWTLLTCQ